MALSESPARISPLTVTGRIRTSPAARLLLRLATLDAIFDLTLFSLNPNLIPVAEVPASYQPLRSPVSASSSQFEEILGTIDIARNPGQSQDNARQAGCLGRGQMRQKTVIPEAQREQIGWRPPGCVGAAPGYVRY